MNGSDAGERQVLVYRSTRVADLYLLVDAGDGLARVPAALLERFGRAEEALSFALTKERRLARVDARAVLTALDETGYYLQLPPSPEAGI